MQDQIGERLALLQREIQFRQNEVTKLKEQLSTRQSEASSAHTAASANLDRNSELQSTLVTKDSQIKRQQDEIVRLKHDYDGMLMTRLGEGTSQMQLEAYRRENTRLLQMLAQTGEFKEFANMALDSGNSGVRFMDPKAAPTASEVKPAAKEQEDWIPEDAYKVAHDFRNKCASNISRAMMN